MIIRSTFFSLLFSLFSISTIAADIPFRWNVDTTRPAPAALTIRRGETILLEPIFQTYDAFVDLTDYSTVTMRYRSTDMTNTYYSITGTVANASNGVARIRWTPSAEPTNSSLSYEILVGTATSAVIRAYGSISLQASLADNGSTNVLPMQTGFLRSSTGRTCVITNVVDGITNLLTFIAGQLQ